MEKKIANQLMNSFNVLGQSLNESAGIIEQITDVEEKKRFRKNIGELMGRLYTDLQMPIIKQYPDLDPDK